MAAALVVPSLWNVALSWQPSLATVVALDPASRRVGAPLELWRRAENGATNGRIVGPDRTFPLSLPKHPATGGRARRAGDYVEFTLSAQRMP